MPEGPCINSWDLTLKAVHKRMVKQFGIDQCKWHLTRKQILFASSFATGSAVSKKGGKGRAYTTLWADDVTANLDGNQVVYKVERDEDAFRQACTTSDAGLNPEIEKQIAAGQSIDWDDAKALPGEKYPNGAPWRQNVGFKNSVKGPLSIVARGHELGIRTGDMFLRLNLGLEAQIIVMKTKQWRMISDGGTVPGNNPDPKKASLLRSFLVPKTFNNEFSRKSDDQRLINVFAAWEFCHEDGDTVLLVDWSRIVRMHLFRFQFSFQEDFLLPGHQVYSLLWSDSHGPDFLREPVEHQAVLDQWRNTVRHAGENSPLRRQTIAKEISGNSRVFNGFGVHTANDAAAMMGIHPCTSIYDVCSDDLLWSLLLEELNRCRTAWISKDIEFFARHRNTTNPLEFDQAGETIYINRILKVAQRKLAQIPTTTWKRMAEAGLFDKDHRIGQPYDKQVAFSKRELQSKVKLVNIVRISQGTGTKRAYWYTPVLAKAPDEWKASPPEWCGTGWKDIRTWTLTTKLGGASYRDTKVNQPDPLEIPISGQRKTIITGNVGRPPKNRPTKDQLQALLHPASDDSRVIIPKVGITPPTQSKIIISNEVDGSDERDREDVNPLKAISPVLCHTRKRKRSVESQGHPSRHFDESAGNRDAVTSDEELPEGLMDASIIESAMATYAGIQASISKRRRVNGLRNATLDSGNSTDPGDATSTGQATSLSLFEETGDEDHPVSTYMSSNAASSPGTLNRSQVMLSDSDSEDPGGPRVPWRSRYPQLPASDSESDLDDN